MADETNDGIGFLRMLSDAANAIASRARMANTGGRTFAGARDLYQTCGYQRELQPQDYRSRYRRNAVAGRIVDIKPQDTWRGGFVLVDNPDIDEDTPFEKEWAALSLRLKIPTILQRCDRLAGLGRYAIVLIGAPGEMDTPLERVNAKDIKYLRVYAEDDAPIKEFDIDPKSPRFGEPIFYEVRRTNPQGRSSSGSQLVGKKVHFSRVVHFADDVLDDLVYGQPRLERVWNLLDDLEKVTGGGAEAFWMRANQGMHVDIDASLNPTPEELDAMKADVAAYRHRLERVIRTRGATIKTLGSDTADIKGPSNALMELISTGTGIPTRKLMGSEQGKLAADQDSVSYYRMIEARRVDTAEAQLLRPFVDRLIALGALRKPRNDEFEARWSQIKTRDDDEKAALAGKWAGLNVNGREVVTVDEIREYCLDLDPLEEVDPDEGDDNDDDEDPRPDPSARNAARKGTRDWKKIHKSADRFRPRLERAAREAFDAGRSALNPDALRAALRDKKELEVFALVSGAISAAANALRPALEEALTRVMKSSGGAEARRLNGLRSAAGVRALAGFAFDVTDPNAVEWIREHAGETITDISESTRGRIRELVEDAFEEQFDVDELADRIGELIGDDDRAETIARTETMLASNQGQKEAWSQATDEGLLTGDELQVWIVTPDDRLCEICEPMDGKTAPLNGEFETALGRVDAPPAHPRCRCVVGLQVS